jgi:DNA-directed RNA polymerase specialized sigma24 family protein
VSVDEKAEYAEDLSQGLARIDASRQILDSREFRMMATAREKGLTYAEIAAAKGCTVQSVHAWFSRRDANGKIRVADSV